VYAFFHQCANALMRREQIPMARVLQIPCCLLEKRRNEMRNLKYGVVALTPLLGAGGFAQGLNLGMNDGVILQAQAPAQTGPYDAMNGSGKPETDRQPDADRAGAPMGGVVKLDAPAPSAEGLKTTRRAPAKTQARTGEKKTKDTRTN
jgi:hypothetical protein